MRDASEPDVQNSTVGGWCLPKPRQLFSVENGQNDRAGGISNALEEPLPESAQLPNGRTGSTERPAFLLQCRLGSDGTRFMNG